eukprot:c24814_g2_i2 orf=471-4703(+)
MFDLNEPPEDDIDTFPCDDVQCMQPAQELKAHCMQQKELEPNFVRPYSEVGNAGMAIGCAAFPGHQVDLAPLPLGQHPLSCFRPFVRQISKGSLSDGAMPLAKENSPPKRSIFDQQSMDSSWNPSALNGELVRSEIVPSKQSTEASLVTPGRCDDFGEANGHNILGPEGCDKIVNCLKDGSGNLHETSGSPKESKGTQETSMVLQAAKEVQEETSLRSAPTDACIRMDVSKGVSLAVEDKPGMSFLKRGRSDQKDAMLGKKRARQTMYLDVREAAKQAPPPKAPTVKKNSSLSTARNHKEIPKTPVTPFSNDGRPKDLKSSSPSSNMLKAPWSANSSELKSNSLTSSEGVINDWQAQSQGSVNKILPYSTDEAVDAFSLASATTPSKLTPWRGEGDDKGKVSHLSKPVVGKHPGGGRGKLVEEEKPTSYVRPLAKKNFSNYRKQTVYSQDSSIERLHREATCEKLWNSPGDTELQRVPGSFHSVQEYVNVFEPLLFEECRAQLHSTWEELCEGVTKDPHIQVSVKAVEKRDRGWYDLVLLPLDKHHFRLGFKEGDVAVLSTPRPGSAGRMRRINGSTVNESPEAESVSRIAGIVRRFVPVDVRDLHGAFLHFYVGESLTQTTEELVRKKYQSNGTLWYLTVLGSLATIQREYVALHAFQNLQSQMIKAILSPKPEFFPRYEEAPPAMPDCFTPAFVQHLHRNFNGPQLAAIKWAALHTAAGLGNTSGAAKRQDLWPFTLVQGPPGTGKTHTVWGMLNVIHLVQYQRYYAALLKKLAPDSMKIDESSTENDSSYQGSVLGSIDDVLQKMDQNLLRVLPKLCPKPRMLVCAPSNAATDELLTRVLGRGFIDGEMKVYRPDVARVGVDTQTKASQAVSVERRSDHLLGMSRGDVLGWLQQLRSREAFLGLQVASLQKELSLAAAARSQGSVGVDPDVLAARDQSRDTKLQQLAAVVEERDKVLVEMSRLFIVEGHFRGGFGYSLEDARAKLEASFANEAEIVFTTVSSSGRRLFSNLTHGFDMVVIDEAAQASEAAVLPPLSLGAARCVLIGDPQQLPATVISRAAHTLQYSRSLFERFQQGGCPTLLLTVQYRMHPQIREFPSRYFYQGRLVDSEAVSSLPDEPYHRDSILRPYVFYDVSHGRESHKGNSVSYQNVTEAHFAAQLYEYLQNFIKTAGISKVSVGVITPYKLQLKCLQHEFGSPLVSDAEGKSVYINTVDAFQGQERDVIIMSCVRASSHGVGFVADIRRMNVALTRARRCLWVVGNAAALVQSEDWAALIADAKERGCFISMTSASVKGLLASQNHNTAAVPPTKAPGLLKAPPSRAFNHIIRTDKPETGLQSVLPPDVAHQNNATEDTEKLAVLCNVSAQEPVDDARDNVGSAEPSQSVSSKSSTYTARSDKNYVKQVRRS